MARPVVTVAKGGLAVVDVTATKPGLGLHVVEASNGHGLAVTKAAYGLAVTYDPWEPSPADVPGLMAWYDGGDPSKMSLDGSNRIGAFDASSGLLGAAAQLQQGLITAKPYSLASASLGGRRVINAPIGENRSLSRSVAAQRTAMLGVVLVWRVLDLTSRYFTQMTRNTAPSTRADFQIVAPDLMRYRYGTFGGDFDQYDRTVAANTWYITSTRNRDSWLNGGSQFIMSAGTIAPGATDDVVAALGGAGAEIAQWIVVGSDQISDATMRKLEGFVAWRCGIQASLVAGHPWKNQRP